MYMYVCIYIHVYTCVHLENVYRKMYIYMAEVFFPNPYQIVNCRTWVPFQFFWV